MTLGAASALLTGCQSPPGPVARKWIIGFGWVDTVRTHAVDSQSLSAIGVVAGSDGVSAGVVLRHQTGIDPSAAGDELVEVQATPFDLTVRARNLAPQAPNNQNQ
ncbi:hypothetical protein Hsar01_01689 [Haloferula sargassicola]|uniref:Uncharacterized protein n=1 Tax=Haloferula sargassicola TaxID=490096 RepID=A0ABP9UP63_9BACT